MRRKERIRADSRHVHLFLCRRGRDPRLQDRREPTVKKDRCGVLLQHAHVDFNLSGGRTKYGLFQTALEPLRESAQQRGLEGPEQRLLDAGDSALHLLGGLEEIFGHPLRVDPRLFPGGEQRLRKALLQAGAALLQEGFDPGDDPIRLRLVLRFHRPGGDPFHKIADLVQGGHRPLEDQFQKCLDGQDILILSANAQLVDIPEGVADARPLEAIPAA